MMIRTLVSPPPASANTKEIGAGGEERSNRTRREQSRRVRQQQVGGSTKSERSQLYMYCALVKRLSLPLDPSPGRPPRLSRKVDAIVKERNAKEGRQGASPAELTASSSSPSPSFPPPLSPPLEAHSKIRGPSTLHQPSGPDLSR